MRLISRLLLVAVLLGGLTYGSYAFGKHVLSSALFSPRSGSMQPSTVGVQNGSGSNVFRSGDVRGEPRAEIDILPPGQGGDEPEPSLSAVRRSAERSGSVTPNFESDDAATRSQIADSLTTNRDEARQSDEPTEEPTRRPRKRRKRPVETTAETSPPAPPRRSAQATEPSPSRADVPARALNSEEPSSSGDRGSEGTSSLARPVPVESTPSEPAPEPERTIRRRERVRREPAITPSRPAAAAAAQPPARERMESPIPRPEGDTGGGSPVPLPG